MFGNFGKREGSNQSSELIKSIISDKSKTIEDLLRVEDLLLELSSKNEELIKYFDKEKIKIMIDYIIKEPQIEENAPETTEKKEKGYKFPFLCSQIFGLENNELFKFFFMTNHQINEELAKEKNNALDNNNNLKVQENGMNQMDIEENKNARNISGLEDIIMGGTMENNNNENQNYVNNIKEENINNKENENRIELLDYLFTFFPNEKEEWKELNYVLCGYFNSLISNLLEVNPTVFLKYIYNIRKDVFNLMSAHCYRKSISNALSKILRYEHYFNENTEQLAEDSKNKMNETRINVLIEIFSSIKLDMNNEQLNSIYFFITELFDSASIFEEKKLFITMIENESIIRSIIYSPLFNIDLISNIDENVEKERQNLIVIIDIISFLLKSIKKLKLDIPACTPERLGLKHTLISQAIFDILPKLIEINFNQKNNNEIKMLQSFDKYQLTPLGEFKIKIVDLIYYLIPYFKKISKFFDEILIKSDFFKFGFDFIFQYEWNNIYQESFLSLLKSFLDNSEFHELLFDYLFNKLKIVDIIKNHTNKEDKFKFEKKDSNPISHGYISFLISLSYKINTVIGGDPLGVNSDPSTEGSFEFIPKVNEDNDDMNMMMYGDIEDNDKKEKNEENDVKKGVPIQSMKKYLNDDWKLFFNDNISDVIKQYCDKKWPPKEKNDLDIFDFLFQDNDNDQEDNGKKDEDIVNNNNNSNNNLNINNNEIKDDNNLNINNNNEIKVDNKSDNSDLNKNSMKIECLNEILMSSDGLMKLEAKQAKSSNFVDNNLNINNINNNGIKVGNKSVNKDLNKNSMKIECLNEILMSNDEIMKLQAKEAKSSNFTDKNYNNNANNIGNVNVKEDSESFKTSKKVKEQHVEGLNLSLEKK